MNTLSYSLTDDTIELAQLLKVCSLVGSGGEAKVLITSGEVMVNGIIEIRKKKKLHAGDQIQFRDTLITLTKD